MAQAPQPPHKPAAPPPPLKDPAAGKPPAVGGGHLAKTDEELRREQDKDRGPGGYRPTIGVKGEPIEDGERDPDTIAEEQRRRSAEIEAHGVHAWIEAHDERTAEEKGEHKHVEGTKKLENHKAP